MYSEDNLYRIINEKLKDYQAVTPFINALHRSGMKRINLMIMEMIMLDKPLEQIPKTLLLTEESFEAKLIEITDFFQNQGYI